MRQDRLQELGSGLVALVGQQQFFTNSEQTRPYRTGIRVGHGMACAVVIPNNLLQFWKTLELCVKLDKIIIIQAANTGLTGGSTPNGNDYDRDVVIINTLNLNKIILLKAAIKL